MEIIGADPKWKDKLIAELKEKNKRYLDILKVYADIGSWGSSDNGTYNVFRYDHAYRLAKGVVRDE